MSARDSSENHTEASRAFSEPVSVLEIRAALAEIMKLSSPAQQNGISLHELFQVFQEILSKEPEEVKQNAVLAKNIHDLGFDHVREVVLPYINKELQSITMIIDYAVNHIAQLGESLSEVSALAEPELQKHLKEIATRTLETCSFQDVVGQRMQTIVSLVQEIEAIQHGIKGMLGDQNAKRAYQKHRTENPKPSSQSPQAQSKTKRSSQSDVDKMFST